MFRTALHDGFLFASPLQAALREIEDAAENAGATPPLILFSGDALNPSLLSQDTKGAHMICILNELGVRCSVRARPTHLHPAAAPSRRWAGMAAISRGSKLGMRARRKVTRAHTCARAGHLTWLVAILMFD